MCSIAFSFRLVNRISPSLANVHKSQCKSVTFFMNEFDLHRIFFHNNVQLQHIMERAPSDIENLDLTSNDIWDLERTPSDIIALDSTPVGVVDLERTPSHIEPFSDEAEDSTHSQFQEPKVDNTPPIARRVRFRTVGPTPPAHVTVPNEDRGQTQQQTAINTNNNNRISYAASREHTVEEQEDGTHLKDRTQVRDSLAQDTQDHTDENDSAGLEAPFAPQESGANSATKDTPGVSSLPVRDQTAHLKHTPDSSSSQIHDKDNRTK